MMFGTRDYSRSVVDCQLAQHVTWGSAIQTGCCMTLTLQLMSVRHHCNTALASITETPK